MKSFCKYRVLGLSKGLRGGVGGGRGRVAMEERCMTPWVCGERGRVAMEERCVTQWVCGERGRVAME